MPDESRMTVSAEFRTLAASSRSELERLFLRGRAPAPTALVGAPYLGWNLPGWAEVLRIRKFVKGFTVVGSGVLGHNTPVRQNGLDGDWQPLPSAATPKRFGFFGVHPADPAAARGHPDALLLDYGVPENGRFGITRLIRDHLVAVEPGSADLLLGRAYLAMGPRLLPVSVFLLERARPAPGAGP